MLMPETAMDKYGLLIRQPHNIGFAGQFLCMKPKAKPLPVDEAANY